MSRHFEVRTPARRDLTGHIEYIARDSVEAARRFLDKFEETAGILASMPEMGSSRTYPNSALSEVRFFPVKDFDRYLIFYYPTSQGIAVIRVLHSSQDIRSILG
jgi:toxin ParE1/3/4